MTEHYIGPAPKNSDLGITVQDEKPKLCPVCGEEEPKTVLDGVKVTISRN